MEWYVELSLHYPARRDPRSEEYADLAVEFYDALSEYLGGEEFTSPMGLLEGGLETCVYLDAETAQEASKLAQRMFCEVSERSWGAGTKVEVERVLTAAERDEELEAELDSLDRD